VTHVFLSFYTHNMSYRPRYNRRRSYRTTRTKRSTGRIAKRSLGYGSGMYDPALDGLLAGVGPVANKVFKFAKRLRGNVRTHPSRENPDLAYIPLGGGATDKPPILPTKPTTNTNWRMKYVHPDLHKYISPDATWLPGSTIGYKDGVPIDYDGIDEHNDQYLDYINPAQWAVAGSLFAPYASQAKNLYKAVAKQAANSPLAKRLSPVFDKAIDFVGGTPAKIYNYFTPAKVTPRAIRSMSSSRTTPYRPPFNTSSANTQFSPLSPKIAKKYGVEANLSPKIAKKYGLDKPYSRKPKPSQPSFRNPRPTRKSTRRTKND